MLALVTGGLHRVGATIAARLAAAGYDLALHAHRAGDPNPALKQAISDHGVQSAVFAADLAIEAERDALVGQVAAYFGRAPNALVNSASIISEGTWGDLAHDDLSRHLATNFVAPMLLTRTFAAALDSGEGGVVNILDQRIVNPPVDQAAYTASKLALASVTRVMARAFAPRVRINAIAPGNTIPGEGYSAAQWDRLAEATPLERHSAPADIAEGVAYLLAAKATTGQILFVDGGANLESWRRDFVHLMRD